MKALLKSAFGSVIAVVLFFAAVSFFSVRSSKKMIVTQAEEAVRNLVKTTTGKIDRLMSDVETAVASQKWIIGEKLGDPDYMYKITRELVENSPYIVGSTVVKSQIYATYTAAALDEGGEIPAAYADWVSEVLRARDIVVQHGENLMQLEVTAENAEGAQPSVEKEVDAQSGRITLRFRIGHVHG